MLKFSPFLCEICLNSSNCNMPNLYVDFFLGPCRMKRDEPIFPINLMTLFCFFDLSSCMQRIMKWSLLLELFLDTIRRYTKASALKDKVSLLMFLWWFLTSDLHIFWALKRLVECEVRILYYYLLLILQNGKGGNRCPKMKLRLHLLVLCVIIMFLVYNMANFQHKQTLVTINIPWFIETEFSEHKYIWKINLMWSCNFTVGSKISSIWYSDGVWTLYFHRKSADLLFLPVNPEADFPLLLSCDLALQCKHQVSDRDAVKLPQKAVPRIGYLPHGIVESNSDMELKPLWLTTTVQSQVS